MKKQLLFTLLALGGLSQVKAQNKNVVSAINYLQYYMKDKNADDLLEAKKYLDEAAANEETKERAKTWINRAKIYYAILESQDPKVKEQAGNSLDEVYKSYKRTAELDAKGTYPEAKDGLRMVVARYTNKGIDAFNRKAYSEALTGFEAAILIGKESLNTLDTNLVFNAGLAAEKAENLGKAKEYYRQLIELKGKIDKDPAKPYLFLIAVCRSMKDEAGMLAAIQEGRKAYPDFNPLVIEELNYYLTTGKMEEAITNINLAIQKEPNNQMLFYNLGVIYDNISAKSKNDKEFAGNFQKANEAYDKALGIKPDYFDALYNKGALYFNRAVKMNEAANAITDNTKFKVESEKADKAFREALPILEKAAEVGTEDKGTMRGLYENLKQIYLMTEQPDKVKAMTEKLKSL